MGWRWGGKGGSRGSRSLMRRKRTMSDGPNHNICETAVLWLFLPTSQPSARRGQAKRKAESAERSRREPRIRYILQLWFCRIPHLHFRPLSTSATALFHVMNYSEHDERSVKHQLIRHATEFAKTDNSFDSGSSSKRQCGAQHECSACSSSPPPPPPPPQPAAMRLTRARCNR